MKRDPPALRDVTRLLVVKMSALGDVAKAIPTVRAIRGAHRHLRVGWVIRPGISDLLTGNPDIDEIIEAPRSLRALPATVRAVRRFQPEVLLDMQGLLLSGVLARLSGAPWRCTWDSGREMSGVLTGNPIVPASVHQNAAEALFGFARAMGIASPDDDAPSYLVAGADLAGTTDEMLDALPRPLVGMHIGASTPAKAWPQHHWRELTRLALADGMGVVLFGGPSETSVAAAVSDGQGPRCRTLAGRTSPRQLASAISRCAVFVGGDTGATHIAALVRTPTVCLMGPTDPVLMGPWGDQHTSVHLGLPCSPCWRKPTCGGRYECMSGITPERVYAEIIAALRNHAREPH